MPAFYAGKLFAVRFRVPIARMKSEGCFIFGRGFLPYTVVALKHTADEIFKAASHLQAIEKKQAIQWMNRGYEISDIQGVQDFP